MTFDFDTPVNRRGTDSVKWAVGENELPMWVADMDFRTAPSVEKAILDRAAEGVFGYAVFPPAWYDAYRNWWRDRHGFAVEREWLGFASGVIPAASAAVRALSEKGDGVAVLTPNYGAFFGITENQGRTLREVPMLLEWRGGRPDYRIDWDALEAVLADGGTRLFIFCNPQNPTGKIWERETMARIGELCREYGVTVLSDEIHSDIAAPGFRVTPFAAVNEVNRDLTVTFLAPTKAFNIMSLHSAAVVAADPELRKKVFGALGDLASANVFAASAAVAAFSAEGGEWLDALNAYIAANKNRVTEFLAEELPEITAAPGDATYLMWLHTGKIAGDSEDFQQFLRKETGLYVCPGIWYRGDGKQFLRFNAACPRFQLEDALARLKEGADKYRSR